MRLFKLLGVKFDLDSFNVLILSCGFRFCHSDSLLFLLEDLLLLLYLIPDRHSVFSEPLLITLLFNLMIPSLLDLFPQLLYTSHVVNDLLFTLLAALQEIPVSLPLPFKLFFLLFFGLDKVFKFFTKHLQSIFFSKLYVLLPLNLQDGYFSSECLDLVSLLLLFVTLVLHLFIRLAHLLF